MKELNLRFLKSDKITEFIKKYKYILLIGLCGIVLILIPVNNQKKEESNVVEKEIVGFNVEEYEHKLEEILSQVEGAGKVNVMLSLKSGVETIYAKEGSNQTSESKGDNDTNLSISRDDKIVMKSAGGGDEPVVVKINYPVFSGAIIVCQGADNPLAQYSIIKAVASITGLGTDKITVLKRN